MTVGVLTRTLPHRVYRCIDNRTDRLLYIGLSHDVPARMVVHRADRRSRASALLRRCDFRVEVDPTSYPDRASGEAAERVAIRLDAPLFNIQHTGVPIWLHRMQVQRYIDGLPEA